MTPLLLRKVNCYNRQTDRQKDPRITDIQTDRLKYLKTNLLGYFSSFIIEKSELFNSFVDGKSLHKVGNVPHLFLNKVHDVKVLDASLSSISWSIGYAIVKHLNLKFQLIEDGHASFTSYTLGLLNISFFWEIDFCNPFPDNMGQIKHVLEFFFRQTVSSGNRF